MGARVSRGRPNRRRALAYRNDEIVAKFRESWDVTQAEAEDLFEETLRLLWVIQTSRANGKHFKVEPAFYILDQMWHTFALFTPEYRAYCERAYGRFLEHTPTTRAEVAAKADEIARDPEGFAERELATSVYKWQLVRETFGDETLVKWWVELPTRYDARFFQTAAIPLAPNYRPPPRLAALLKRRGAIKKRRRAS